MTKRDNHSPQGPPAGGRVRRSQGRMRHFKLGVDENPRHRASGQPGDQGRPEGKSGVDMWSAGIRRERSAAGGERGEPGDRGNRGWWRRQGTKELGTTGKGGQGRREAETGRARL